MIVHPSIREISEKFQAKQLHAARSGRDVMRAFAEVSADSRAANTQALCNEIEDAVDALLAVLPAYAPPLNVMHLVMSRIEEALVNELTVEALKAVIASDAGNYMEWAEIARERIARCGAELVPEGSTVFTFTLSETMLRTFREASCQGKRFRVLVTESRPNNDGLITATQLAQEGIPVEISIDAGIGELVPRADIMLVGAEGVMTDGSVVCKVGTYLAALVANAHGVPVYVIVDSMKLSLTSILGLPMRLEPIQEIDLYDTTCSGRARVIGHLFDQTPPELINGLVTERGILHPKDCVALMGEMRLSSKLSEKLHAWAFRDG